MGWVVLLLAGLFEVAWAVGLKYTEGFTKLHPTLFTIGTMLLSFWFLSLAIKTLPLGVAYAVWTGIGIVGTVFFGNIWLGEAFTFTKMMFILLILIGILGLKLTS